MIKVRLPRELRDVFRRRMATSISFASVFWAFGFSAGVGIVFGFYPARKASMLEPIEALRHD